MSTSVFALNVARALAHAAADLVEPFAGRLIDDAERERLATAINSALVENLPPLPNLVSA